MATTAIAELVQSQGSGAPSRSPMDLGHPLLFSQAYQQGAALEVEQLRIKLVVLWNGDTTGGSLTYYAIVSSLDYSISHTISF